MKASQHVFRALADGTRRDILRMLREGPLTSGEIASRFESSWPTVSRHLSVLREAGLVVAERSGQEVVYELDTSVFQDLIQHLMEWMPVGSRSPSKRASRRARSQET
jgi:DNA-binding transcriptional ArsR family regulator